MAQIGRTTPTSATTAIAASRPTVAASNVASLGRSPIEALNAKLGTSLGDAFLFNAACNAYQNGGRHSGEGEQTGERGEGLVCATSQAFSAFLEFDSGSESAAGTGWRGGSTSFAGVLARAINTYETNARIISGSMVPRGTTLSLNL